MSAKFTNNATATLAASLSTSSTSITVTTSQGALFPTLSAGDYFFATLINSSNNIEIVKITARASDVLTAVRAQEGTTALTWNAADRLELRATAAVLTNFAQLDSPNTFAGAMTYGGVTLANAVTGTGNMVLASSPTLASPTLTTPTVNNPTITVGMTYGGVALANSVTGTGSMVLASSPSLASPTLTTPIIDNPKLGYATTVTAAGTTTLTVTSANQQFFTGTTTQTVVLPVTSTLTLGMGYFIKNNSTGVVTVQSSGGNVIRTLQPGKYVTFVCVLLTGTTADSWDYQEIPADVQIQPLSASVASNALTISTANLTMDFRSTTLSSGTVTTVSGTPANLVISSGSTLGTVSAQKSRIVVLAINNAGTIELAAVNIAGGNSLDETNLISTTAEGGAGAADSATVVYSTTARTSLAYRVIGFIDSTQTTAGTWATAPSTIQGYGGQALNAMSSLGYGQTWQNVEASRAEGVTYYNETGRPIAFNVTFTITNTAGTASANIGGLSFVFTGYGTTQGAVTCGSGTLIVPVGMSYLVSGSGTMNNWTELR